MPDCEQCKRVPATRIWSNDGHFPGVYLCSKCNTQPSKATVKLITSRRGRRVEILAEIEREKSPKAARPARSAEKTTQSAPPSQGHRPGQNWQSTSCLCTCHVEATVGCDDKMCAAWRTQLQGVVQPAAHRVVAPEKQGSRPAPLTIPTLEELTW